MVFLLVVWLFVSSLIYSVLLGVFASAISALHGFLFDADYLLDLVIISVCIPLCQVHLAVPIILWLFDCSVPIILWPCDCSLPFFL